MKREDILSYHGHVIHSIRTLGLILIFSLFSCAFDNDPRAVAQQYLFLVYNFRFAQIKPIARGEALMAVAYFEGRASEMSEQEKLALANPQITINTVQMRGTEEATVETTLLFQGGNSRTLSLIIRKYGYRWCVAFVNPPLVSEEVYAY